MAIKHVQNREGTETGTVVTGSRACTCCGGTKIRVRWPDGKHTWPCPNGLRPVAEKKDTWRIL
jgi:hypothetical protein